MRNYTIYHLHSDYSTCITSIDSATKIDMYIDKAKECGMTQIGFSEHGSCLNWYKKKTLIENGSMKYIHGAELYITETLEEKIRDNYHCILIARNFNGFLELNELISKSFNRDDNHYYYVPRISIDELLNTSDNILITTACLGGVLSKGTDIIKDKYISFLIKNKHRCFLEIQHHNIEDQINYNKILYKLSQEFKIPLIAGTDTHSLNKELAEARVVLQKAKNIYFDNEDGWDLTFKTYDELLEAYKNQKSLPKEVYLQAIENTNVLGDMVEEFYINKDPKYPKLFDNSEQVLRDKVYESLETHPYALKHHPKEKIVERIEEELDVYKKTKSVDFMLLQKYVRDWEKDNGIYCGPSRGSISGSMIAYILGITEADSIKFNLNFYRFMNPSRVSNADIDTDYSDQDRNTVRSFLLENDKFNSAEIVTFNTIALKGAIRDVCRAMDMSLDVVNEICNNIELKEDDYRKKYPEVFKYVDLLNGVIVSVGTHPAGVLISDLNIREHVGLFSLSTTDYPVACVDMYGLDDMFFVKLDILGLDNVGVINETCKLAEIEKVNPDNIDLDDWEVWKSIREDNTCIFQFESDMAKQYLQMMFSDKTLERVKSRVPDIKPLKLFSFLNGLLRPGSASIRDDACNGVFHENGLEEIDQFLANTLGYVAMQEDIMMFLVEFCGYSMAESDNIRRHIGKKKNTEQLLPEIEQRFVEYTSSKYNVSKEKCEEIIKPFLQIVLDSSSYAFSWNHSDMYSFIGYACGWLRYYYPIEFITACLNIWSDKEDKTIRILEYVKKTGIKIESIKFRYSRSNYFFDKETNSIYRGIASIKHLNERIGEELYTIKDMQFKTFVDFLIYIEENLSINSKQMDILIKLNFFEEFGKNQKLTTIYDEFKGGKNRYNKNHKDNTKEKRTIALKEFEPTVEDSVLPIKEQLEFEAEILGSIQSVYKLPGKYVYVLDIDKKYSPKVKLYGITTGKTAEMKISKKTFNMNKIEKGDILSITKHNVKPKMRKTDNGFEPVPNSRDFWITEYTRVKIN